MANLRVNNVVGFGSTDAGVNFTGPIKLNTQGYMYFPTGITTERGRGRAAVGGGYDGSSVRDEIEYFNIQSMGTAIDFGNLTSTGRRYTSSFSSSTRGFSAGGKDDPAVTNEIDYCEIAQLNTWLDLIEIFTYLRFLKYLKLYKFLF